MSKSNSSANTDIKYNAYSRRKDFGYLYSQEDLSTLARALIYPKTIKLANVMVCFLHKDSEIQEFNKVLFDNIAPCARSVGIYGMDGHWVCFAKHIEVKNGVSHMSVVIKDSINSGNRTLHNKIQQAWDESEFKIKHPNAVFNMIYFGSGDQHGPSCGLFAFKNAEILVAMSQQDLQQMIDSKSEGSHFFKPNEAEMLFGRNSMGEEYAKATIYWYLKNSEVEDRALDFNRVVEDFWRNLCANDMQKKQELKTALVEFLREKNINDVTRYLGSKDRQDLAKRFANDHVKLAAKHIQKLVAQYNRVKTKFDEKILEDLNNSLSVLWYNSQPKFAAVFDGIEKYMSAIEQLIFIFANNTAPDFKDFYNEIVQYNSQSNNIRYQDLLGVVFQELMLTPFTPKEFYPDSIAQEMITRVVDHNYNLSYALKLEGRSDGKYKFAADSISYFYTSLFVDKLWLGLKPLLDLQRPAGVAAAGYNAAPVDYAKFLEDIAVLFFNNTENIFGVMYLILNRNTSCKNVQDFMDCKHIETVNVFREKEAKKLFVDFCAKWTATTQKVVESFRELQEKRMTGAPKENIEVNKASFVDLFLGALDELRGFAKPAYLASFDKEIASDVSLYKTYPELEIAHLSLSGQFIESIYD